MEQTLSDQTPVQRSLSPSRLANISAETIFQAFSGFQQRFLEITRRARQRFETCDWRGLQSDSVERLDLYRDVVDPTVAAVTAQLGENLHEKLVWSSMKAVYSGAISGRDDWELAETFFNSITRRVFATRGVDPHIEFVDTDFDLPPTPAALPAFFSFPRSASIDQLLSQILDVYPFAVTYAHREADIAAISSRIAAHLRSLSALMVIDHAEMVRSVFYRNKGAYLVGRLSSGSHVFPLILALLNTPQGLVIDAVLLDEDAVSVLFSFAHSYFFVEVSRPHDLVAFLRSIMPRKRSAELYISLGYNKHGKTELYRDLLSHLSRASDRFEIAPGEPGMVMVVFTMPSYDLVFKVIRDRFGYSKNTSRSAVKAKYHLVFKHDRAGRLIDAQEFEHLKFDQRYFSPALLEEMSRSAGDSVTINTNDVVISHLYAERRLTPLDIYTRDAAPEAAAAAALDYGNAIKDLAATNIFPGDVLLKNFGVTRHGRVVFYDYDELCLLTECNFRSLPQSGEYDQEMDADPWYYVAENDIFPEEFRTFLGFQGELRQTFLDQHSNLFDAGFWRGVQQRLRAGEVLDIYPYHHRHRL